VAPAIARLTEFFRTRLTELNNVMAPAALAASVIDLDDEVIHPIDDLMADALPVAGPSPEGM
jgi:hypothetical protein